MEFVLESSASEEEEEEDLGTSQENWETIDR